ncbi:MAG: hypothetical protein NTY87_12900 [Planctomycetia bacterium]|nr:hypothetical protein [Planctomycetia bacterium]
MPFDSYSPCPGGTGKKIKFCCADLITDLEQLDRLVEGDQISAALVQVERLSQRYPNRPCLLATRINLELSTKQFAEAAITSRTFLEGFPDNPLALGHAAIAAAMTGNIQEAASLFDKSRTASAETVSPELVKIAATLVQASAQAGHVGFAQGIVEWMRDKSIGSPEDRRLLVSVVGSSGVPAALRTKMRLLEPPADAAYRPAFDAAIDLAKSWKLAESLSAFGSLKDVAGKSRQLLTNIAILCEMLARPFEASEAWLAAAELAASGAISGDSDHAVELTGRAISLETETDEDRSPQILFERTQATLPTIEGSAAAIELLEDKLRHSPWCETAQFDRAEWVSRGTAPPRSVWRVFEATQVGYARLLASLLIFGRQTDREPEAVLQGFAPDVATARTIVEPLLGCAFQATAEREGLPATTPTNWLLAAQFRMSPPESGTVTDLPAIDALLLRQDAALWQRFLAVWPDTPLPELLGKTPREAVQLPAGARRVEALIIEGEATSRRRDAADAWAAMRQRLALAPPSTLESLRPLEELPPMRWHRVAMQSLDLDQLRGLFLTALNAGFDLAAERAAEAITIRTDTSPEDRWEALGLLEDRALLSDRKLEIIAEMRGIAKTLKVSDGMVDVAELRIAMQRGDQMSIVRLLDHLRREHSRDQKVLEALAEVLSEAGFDLASLASQAGMGQGSGLPIAGPAGVTRSSQPESPGIWTPGSQQGGSSGEKKAIWTPGS